MSGTSWMCRTRATTTRLAWRPGAGQGAGPGTRNGIGGSVERVPHGRAILARRAAATRRTSGLPAATAWTYDMEGASSLAPRTFPKIPGLNLGKTALQNWHGMLFAGKTRRRERTSPGSRAPDDFDFPAICSTASRSWSRANWKNLHRGLPRGLPRDPLPSGTGQLRHLRTISSGTSPTPIRAQWSE